MASLEIVNADKVCDENNSWGGQIFSHSQLSGIFNNNYCECQYISPCEYKSRQNWRSEVRFTFEVCSIKMMRLLKKCVFENCQIYIPNVYLEIVRFFQKLCIWKLSDFHPKCESQNCQISIQNVNPKIVRFPPKMCI